MDGARPLDPSELLAHVSWVHRLARALVRDADAAEDLAQETLRVTLAQPGGRVRGGASLRAWLKRVARRLALDRWRADASRALRERAVAPREPTEGTFEVVARSARQQRVVAAVHELAEPYRSTILYRYLDELSTREVARRMEVSEEAVRKRLERGLAQLRVRLDAEFASDTKSWALALLSLPGVVAVGVKAKLAVAAVVVVAAALTWKGLLPPREHRNAQPPAVAATMPEPVTAPPPTTPATPTAPAVREAAPDLAKKEPATATTAGDATILHVRVVTTDQRPCTSGHLSGFWSEDRWGGELRRSVEEEIAGPVTDLVLPVIASAATLTASVEGMPASGRTHAVELRTEEDPKLRHGRIEKSVTIVVGGHESSPRLTGRITVDGEEQVPPGLDFFLQTQPGVGESEPRIRVHSLDASYEIGPIHPQIQQIIVTSDETVPKSFKVHFDGREASLDLDLETGRTLRLTVVDRRTNAPLPGRELHLWMDYNYETTIFESRWRHHSHYLRTDRDGVAVVTGLPQRANCSVRRDGNFVVRSLEVNAGEKMEQNVLSEPLLSFEITKESPKLIERTLRMDAEPRSRRIFGQLAASLLTDGEFGEEAAEVHYATIRPDGRWYRDDWTIPHDEQGRWQLEVKPDTEYKLFVERERRRISNVLSVKVADDDVGPVELEPRPGTDVLLRLVHCPAEGFVSLSVSDPGAVTRLGTTRPIHGETFERRLRLEGPSTVSVSCFKEMSSHNSAATKTVQVDPATMPVLEIDVACPDARDVELQLSPLQLPEEVHVQLIGLSTPDDAHSSSSVNIALVAGRSRDPVAVAPGRYLYWFAPRIPDALILGVVDVTAGPADRPIVIRCELEPHPRSALGAGIEITELGGHDVKGLWPRLLNYRFAEQAKSGGDSVLLPKGAKFTVLEK